MPARRRLPRRRLQARPDRAAAPRGRRRRHEERRDRGRLDRREGDARPLHAHGRRAVSRLRLRIPRRATSRRRTRAIVRERGPCEIHRRSWRARAYLSRRSSSPRHPSERRAALVVPPARLPHPRRRTAGLAGTSSTSSRAAGRSLVFCEVKSKAGDRLRRPARDGDAGEVARVRRAAEAWLAGAPGARRPRCALRRRSPSGQAGWSVVQDAF